MANNPQFSGIQPPLGGSMDPPRNFGPPMPMPFRPPVPVQQLQHFVPAAPPHFQPVGRGVPIMNAGMPTQHPQPQFPQPMQQLPARPGQPGMGPPPLQPNMHVAAGPLPPPPSVQIPNNYTPGFGGPGLPLSSSYTFAPSSYVPPVTFNAVSQYQPVSQAHAPSIPLAGQPMLPPVSQSTTPVTPLQHNSEQSTASTATTANIPPMVIQPKPAEEASRDWKEHTSANGRRFYYNKKTRESTWEKPFELMTPIERADATTDWKEYTSPDGRKFYHNKVSKQSKWEIPEELKLARERVGKAPIMESQSTTSVNSQDPSTVPQVVDTTPPRADSMNSSAQEAPLSPVPVIPVATTGTIQSQLTSQSSVSPVVASPVTTSTDELKITNTPTATALGSAEVANITTVKMTNTLNSPAPDISCSVDKVLVQDKEEAQKDVGLGEKVDKILLEEKTVGQEPITYADKLEAKNAFKALLESANIGSDWSWDQAMRVIINDRRYGALKTLGERKQAFTEYLSDKRKHEAEERRNKQKKAREEFRNMLEESKELTSSVRWSKALALFEDDERFKAIEREKERRDLFEAYLQELEEKEQAKAQEERKRHIIEYRQFLESCEFIKANTQWRKVQDQLEADERCSRLERIDRLEIFQDYLLDLEKEEEEHRKMQKEELRKTERKNRDEFRKLMEEHVAEGSLTAKTHWRDYYMKVKDLPAYLEVASNTSGSTPKDLFEDVAEEMQKQYREDRSRIKDVLKVKKVSLASNWTLDEFKTAVVEDITSPPISEVNLKIVFDELLERAREKEEKVAKKHKRLADDFLDLLRSFKDINASSKWDSCKELFEASREFSAIGEESMCKDIFEEYITQLKEQTKENERKRKEEKVKKEKERDERERRKSKYRQDKERGHEREKDTHARDKEEADNDNADVMDTHASNDSKKSGRDSGKKQRKRHQAYEDDINESEKDQSKIYHRRSSDHKRFRRHASTPESDGDGESRYKKHKRDHHTGSRKNGDHNELEDGEFGNDGETR